jgi:hypothetical protein
MRYRNWATAAILGLTLVPGVSCAADFRVLSSWDQTYLVRPKFLEAFLKNVETASKGDMKFIVSGPETVRLSSSCSPQAAACFKCCSHMAPTISDRRLI